MARMYSHEAVMKLLETQRKSIMEFEAAKYELMMGGEQKPVEAVSQRRSVISALHEGLPRNFYWPRGQVMIRPQNLHDMNPEERCIFKLACGDFKRRRAKNAKGRCPSPIQLYNQLVNRINKLYLKEDEVVLVQSVIRAWLVAKKNKRDIDEARVALEAVELSEEEPDIDKFMVALEAVEDWAPEVIHDMVCKIKTYADKRDCDLWEDWVLHTLGFYKHHQEAKRKYGKSTLVNRILHIEPLNK